MSSPCTCLHISRRAHWSPDDAPKIPERVQTRNHIPLGERGEKRAGGSIAEGHCLRRGRRLTLVIHEASAELLERSSVAHGPERTVELIVGHHQVLGVPCHVDDLEWKQ